MAMARKVVAIVGGYRKGGTVDAAVEAILQAARDKGADTQTIYLADQHLEFCTNCRKCTQNPGIQRGICGKADDVQPILRALDAADAIVLGSPVNYWNATALFRQFSGAPDRLHLLAVGTGFSRSPGQEAQPDCGPRLVEFDAGLLYPAADRYCAGTCDFGETAGRPARRKAVDRPQGPAAPSAAVRAHAGPRETHRNSSSLAAYILPIPMPIT
jgi:NAD(P)H-dependent FMN reductase